MMLFNDIFMNDEFYTDFGMTDDVMTSNIIGSGAQFEAKLVRLSPTMSLRTSSDASSRLTEGCCIVLKRPRLSMDPLTHKFTESGTIASIVNEFRVISHPTLRQHPNILDVYGFAWETEDYLPGVSVWPIIMVEFGDLGALDHYLSARLEPLDLETKLRLASGIAHGVDALHKCRIVHSDLKPGNVLVVQGSDGKPVAKLSDFGISLILDERQSPSKWTEGSPGWMAPEWQTSCTNEQLFSTDGMCQYVDLICVGYQLIMPYSIQLRPSPLVYSA
jgi:serine/threonine protein kinase